MRRIGLIGEELTQSAIGAFYAVYDALGSGLLEQLYVAALERELRGRGHKVTREVSVPCSTEESESVFNDSTCWSMIS